METMVGVALFGITFIALYAGMAHGFSSMAMARENLRATQIILEKMETVRLYNWDRVTNSTYMPRTFEVKYAPVTTVSKTGPNVTPAEGTTYSGTISITDGPFGSANYNSRLKQVTVSVTWKTGNLQRSRSLSSLIAYDGLYTYVY